MQVSDILRHKGTEVATVTPDATVEEAARILGNRRIGALVVSEDGRGVDGILSERDIVAHLASVGRTGLDSTVATLMTRHVYTCAPQDTIEDVMSVMTQSRIRHLPVIVDGALGGIVSIGDAVERRVNELETERAQLTDYLQTGRT
jgi:CBS domain-containing protein